MSVSWHLAIFSPSQVDDWCEHTIRTQLSGLGARVLLPERKVTLSLPAVDRPPVPLCHAGHHAGRALAEVPPEILPRHPGGAAVGGVEAGHDGRAAELEVLRLLAGVVDGAALVGAADEVAPVSIARAEDGAVAGEAVQVEAGGQNRLVSKISPLHLWRSLDQR